MKYILFCFLLISYSTNAQLGDIKKDTLQIEKKLATALENYSGENSSHLAISEATSAYDKLLNKYYKYCLTVFSDECKNSLIESQKSWLSCMAKEYIFIEKKHGSGEISKTMILLDKLQILKKRVIELYEHAISAELSNCAK